jgi:hypothetical protein
VRPSTTPAATARPLRDAVYLSTPEGDHTLFAARVLIGRGSHCRVIVLDPLVSREHALLTISPTEVLLEDLHSANGVYVNNVRIFSAQALHDGDRILIGTHELAVFALDSEPRTRAPRARLSMPTGRSIQPGAPTDRADALETLGRLADRMLEQDMPGDAERVLTDHLERLLIGARSGLPVPQRTSTAAARRALVLAAHVHDGRWVDYAIELHLRAEASFPEELVPTLETALAECRNVDRALYQHYLAWLRAAVPHLGLSAKQTFDDLVRLAPS